MLPQFNSLKAVFEAFPDDATALSHFEAIHWKHGAFCPYCKGQRVMHFSDGKTHKCSDCRKRFSVKTGTIFEDTKLGMHIWFAAIWLLLNRPKGIASTQLATDLGITQKSAWFVLHRLRYASRTRSFARPLAGEVEADESALGGRVPNMPKAKRAKLDRVDGGNKILAMALIERATPGKPAEVRAKVIADTSGKTLQAEVRANVEPTSILYTDGARGYRALGERKGGEYLHFFVDHDAEEYVREKIIHVNTVEGFWSLAKRQYHGTHHYISGKHMNAYLDEMCYRWNRRDVHKSERVDSLLGRVAGRLTYKALIGDEQETAAA